MKDPPLPSSGRVVTRIATAFATLALIGTMACDQTPTAPAPVAAPKVPTAGPAKTVAPGTLAVYTDRTAWQAAVAAAGATPQFYDYTGLTLGHITTRNFNYGPFSMAVDLLSSSTFSNPGIDLFTEAQCTGIGYGSGDCPRMLFNEIAPTWQSLTPPFDMPTVDSLIMPQPIVAFGAYFAQTGVAVGCGSGCPAPTGPISIHFGGADHVLNADVPTGYGFIGFIAGTPSTTITFTYAQGTSGWANELIEVYRPEFANGTAVTETPSQLIGDLKGFVDGSGIPKGNATSIDSKLNLALAAIAANQTATACTYMQDVINYTNAQSSKKIPTVTAADIVSQANDIRTALGC